MGMHLQLYASQSITPNEAQVWCHCKLHEITRSPSPEEAAICKKVDAAVPFISPDRFEHGSKSAVHVFDFLTYESYVITPELIDRVVEAQFRLKLPSQHLVDWLTQRLDWTLWGYNDGL